MAKASTCKPDAASLLDWYDRHRRDLPWRARPGETPDPYRVWLAEIMLQQTTVQAVIPYYLRFLERWPSVSDLARARRAEVMAAWAGLGYYARARRLHECARIVAFRMGGRFPDTRAELLALPGIGAYTSGAVAAIVWNRAVAAIDGNVERVMARVCALEEAFPGAGKAVRAAVEAMIPRDRPGDFAQALMDLGATTCTPRKPACTSCPWHAACAGRRKGLVDQLPRKPRRKERPHRHALAFWLERGDGAVLLRRRPDDMLLGGMLEVPSTPWRDAPWTLEEARAHAPRKGTWRLLPGVVHHGFTHVTIDLEVAVLRTAKPAGSGLWHHPGTFASLEIPAMTGKIARHALRASWPHP